jgi:hypothetical protein
VESIPDCSDASVETVRTRIEAMIAAVPDVHRTSNDFDHDGRADILWHNAITGESQVWLMKEASRIGRATILADANPIFILPPWHIVGTRDFEGDGATDVLWHNATSGETQVWLMNGYVIRDRVTVLAENGTPALVGPPWSIVGTNDFDQNRTSDILWHNGASGETQIWRMNGHRITHRVTVVDEDGRPILVGQPWSIVGTNDFDRNDAADIVWHNATTGETQIWRMNGHRITHRVTVVDEKGRPILVGAPWKIVGTDYFDPDKAPDILWHNETTGETQIWYMREWSIGRRVTVDARHDGGGHLVGPPWRIMNH